MTVPGVQSALSVKNAGVEMLTESAKTQAVSGSDQFGAVMQQSMTKQSADKSSKTVVKDAGDDAGYKIPVVSDGQNVKVAQSQNLQLNDTGNVNISGELVEDIVQDVFIKIWENNLRISNGVSLDSYLYVAVRNGCVSYIRRVKPSEGLEVIAEREVEETLLEDWKFVWDAVEELPERCRLVLKLVVLEDMKYAEVAERLDISINTVKGQMKIAYRELRKKFSTGQLVLLYGLFRLNRY